MKQYFFLVFLLVTGYSIFAQESEVYFRNYSSEIVKTEQGLSQNSVRSIMQDSHGLMWFGTWDGLNRFNGLDFEIFRSDYSAKSGQLPDQTVNSIIEDKYGYLWIGTDNGLSCFDPVTEKFRSYFHVPGDSSSLSNDTVKVISTDRDGNIWIGTQKGLNKLIDTSGIFKTYYALEDNSFSLSNNSVRDIYHDTRGTLWIATAGGLNKFIPSKNKFITISSDKQNARWIIDDAVNTIIELPNQDLMIGTEQGVSVISSRGTNKFNLSSFDDKSPLGKAQFMDLCIDHKGKVWIATAGSGIFHFYPDENRLISLNDKPAYKKINEDFVNVIFEDHQGIIWIGYAWKGLNKVVPSKSYFSHYKQNESGNSGLLSNSVWSVIQVDQNRFFVATDKGISVFNNKTKTFSSIRKKDGLSSNNIRAMHKDSRDNVWIGTFSKGLMLYSLEDNHYRYFGNKPDGPYSMFNNNAIWSIIEDHQGYIWLGTMNGLYRIKPAKDTLYLKPFLHESNDPGSISSNVVYSVFEGLNNNIWVGTYGGLNKYSPGDEKFESFKHIIGDSTSISTNKVFSVTQDKDGFLWIGTRGGGLNRMNPYNGKFTHYTTKDGLANNVVYDIIIDYSGYLWLSTNKGLSRFDPGSNTFVNYDINDGIQSYEFNLGAAFKSDQGYIFFGGMNGFNVFLPSKIQQSQIMPQLTVSQISIYNKIIPGIFFDGDTLTVSHDDNFISLEFAALDYSNPIKNQYKYKLEGISDKWINTTADKNVAEFTNLTPGKYKFYLMGTNSDGVWSNKSMELTIIVKPAWYQTHWFRFGFILLLIIVIIFLINGRISRIRKEHQVEKQLFELERKALRLQINPHFIFNTLNSIQNYILEHNKTSAISYLNKFSKMMRQVLYNSDKTFVPLSDEISLIKNYIELERLRFDSQFDYSFYVPDELEEDFVSIPPMLIQPHVENAILHGLVNLNHKKGKLNIRFENHSHETIQCTVDDNGIGRDASAALKAQSRNKHKSRGISITEERLERINNFYSKKLSVTFEDKFDNNGNSTGTKVIMIIPVENI